MPREEGQSPDQRRCMRKKVKLRKHLANDDYCTLTYTGARPCTLNTYRTSSAFTSVRTD